MDEIKHSVKWVFFWMLMASACCVGIWVFMGSKSGLEFAAGYLIEMSLSIDNLFVFMSIFMSFGIKEEVQHRVLNWGIIGAVILRFLFILQQLRVMLILRTMRTIFLSMPAVQFSVGLLRDQKR